jgi:hypothetical protein
MSKVERKLQIRLMSDEWNSLTNKEEEINNKHISNKETCIRKRSSRKATTTTKLTTIQRTSSSDNRHGKTKDLYLPPTQKTEKTDTTDHIITHGSGAKTKNVSKVMKEKPSPSLPHVTISMYQ